MSYNRYFDPAQVESDQKDLIISQLKADQFELRQCELNLQELHAQLNNLDHSLAILKEEKVILEEIYSFNNVFLDPQWERLQATQWSQYEDDLRS